MIILDSSLVMFKDNVLRGSVPEVLHPYGQAVYGAKSADSTQDITPLLSLRTPFMLSPVNDLCFSCCIAVAVRH